MLYQSRLIWVGYGTQYLISLTSLLTDTGAVSATDVVPIALAIKFPGTEIGSGDIDRVFMTAGSSGDPQFFHAKPTSCQTGRSYFQKRRLQ